MRRLALLLLLVLVPAGTAAAAWTGPFARPVAKNPAEALRSLPIEAFRYDGATTCRKGPPAGALALQAWLGRNVAGQSWGIMRCERWGKGQASLHAEGRAIDWRLDARVPQQRREARRLIALLLAPDSAGRPAALARRMGVQGIIHDCRSWFGSGDELRMYGPCRGGRKLDATTAHRDHVHLEVTRNGAAKRTSFWTRRAPALADREGVPDVPFDDGPEPDQDVVPEVPDAPAVVAPDPSGGTTDVQDLPAR